MITGDNTFKNDSKKDTCTSVNKYIQKAEKMRFLTVCIMLYDYSVCANNKLLNVIADDKICSQQQFKVQSV